MASGVAGLSTVIPPFAAPPTFGGGTTPPSEGQAPGPSSQPTGINIPAARPTGKEQAVEAEPALVKLESGQQGIYNPKAPDYLNYHPLSSLGGIQDMMNLFKNIYSGIQKQNQNQINNGKINQVDNTPLTDFTGAPDMATPDTVRQPSQVEPTVGIGTGLPIPEQAVAVGPATQPSQVEPTLTMPSPIGGGAGGITPPAQPSQVEPILTVPSPIGGTAEAGGGAGPGAPTQAQTATAMVGGGFNSLSGIATTFGLSPNTQVNPDGTVDRKYFDSQDEGLTAFRFNSRDPNLRGVSLPVDVIRQSIGDYIHNPRIYQQIKNGQYKMAITNPETGLTKIVNIIEAGPGQTAKSHAAIDMTLRTTKDLGFTGRNQAQFQLIGPDGSAIPLRGYHPGLVSTQQQPTAAAPTSAGDALPGGGPGTVQGYFNYVKQNPAASIDDYQQSLTTGAGAAETVAPATAGTAAADLAIASEMPAGNVETEPLLPEEPSPASAELFGVGADEMAGEFKEGGLVKAKEYQAGGIVNPDLSIPQQPPSPVMPPLPANQTQPFVAHVLGLKEGGEPGKVSGKGEGDKVPALLEPGEFVLKKKAVQRIGVDKLEKMNA